MFLLSSNMTVKGGTLFILVTSRRNDSLKTSYDFVDRSSLS